MPWRSFSVIWGEVEDRVLFPWVPDGEPHPVRNRKKKPVRSPRKTCRKCLAIIMRRPEELCKRLHFVSSRTNYIEVFESWEKFQKNLT
jgi:hypothetical protein